MLFSYFSKQSVSKKGNPYSKAHCSKVNWFEYLHVAYMKRTTHPLSIGTILASYISRMTEYIAIEDDSVISHFLQVLEWKTAVNAVIGNSDGWVPCY